MRAIAWLLRVFCYLFHTILCLALIGLGAVAVLSKVSDMKLETLPWEGADLNTRLIIMGAVGLLTVILAVMGKLRFLLSLWSILVLGMLVRGVFFSSVTFSGLDDFHNWLWLIAGSAVALIGSLTSRARR
jgi:hypothetical protein